MSVIIEQRPKRNLPKPVINKNDKIKKSNCGNVSTSFVNNKEIEFDCEIKIKENNYNPERECISAVKAECHRDEISRNISVTDALKKMESKLCCVIDIRDCRHNQNGHIKGSLSFNCQTRVMMLKAKKSWEMFENKSAHDKIIIYNQKGENTPFLQDFITSVKEDIPNVFFITGGYEEFLKCADKVLIESVIPEDIFDQHHYSPTNEASKSTDVLNATISEILPYLYLGNEIDSKDFEILKKKKITHVLNVTTTVPFSHEGHFVYKRLSATDCNRQDLRAFYNEAFQFIDDANAQKGKVLVHCWAGVSRSATIVAAYLLKHTMLSVMQTISFLRSKRSIVEPNFNFLGQLDRYYSDLEKGIESRAVNHLKSVEDFVRKQADIERVKDLSLSSQSSSSTSPISPAPAKPYFNFIK